MTYGRAAELRLAVADLFFCLLLVKNLKPLVEMPAAFCLADRFHGKIADGTADPKGG